VSLIRNNILITGVSASFATGQVSYSDIGIVSTAAVLTPIFDTTVDNYIYPTLTSGAATTLVTLKMLTIKKL